MQVVVRATPRVSAWDAGRADEGAERRCQKAVPPRCRRVPYGWPSGSTPGRLAQNRVTVVGHFGLTSTVRLQPWLHDLIMRAACVHRLLAGLRDACGGKQRISLVMGRHLWGLARGVLCVGGVALGRVHGVGDAPSTCMRHGTWERPLRGPRVPQIVSKAVLHYHENKNGNASQNTALSLYPPSCPPASAASWLGRSTRRKRLRTALGERPGSNAAIAAHFCPRRSTWLVRT